MEYGGLSTSAYIQEGDGILGSPLHRRADQPPLSIREDTGQIAFYQRPFPM